MISLLAALSLAHAAVPAPASRLAPFDLAREPGAEFTLADAPLPDVAGGTADSERYAKKYLRHLGLANVGLITLGVGVGVTTVGFVVTVGGAVQGSDSTLALGLGTVLLGTLGSYVGQALFSIGGLEAAYDLNHMGRNGPVVMGWVSCGMMAGGLLISTASSVASASGLTTTSATELDPLSTASSVLTIGALIPGFITYFNVRHEGVDLRAGVVPTLVPVRLADGTFGSVPGVALAATW